MREFAVVLFGATGFVGRLAAEYLAQHAHPLRWAIAGRSRDKLEALRERLGGDRAILVADGEDATAMRALAGRASVVLSTAGPFSRYSDKLVEACVEARTDYTDITGETPWVRTLIDRFHARAAADGTRIVPLCGFDSVPSDLGTWVLARWIRERWDQDTVRVLSGFQAKGGFNGGTLASALTMAETSADAMTDELLLNPETHRQGPRTPDRRGVVWSEELGRWLAPFFMAPVNTRVVRRSAALLDSWGEGYGRSFVYDEALESRSRLTALGVSAGTRLMDRALRTGLGRRAARRLGPAPGEGPSEATMDAGFFRTRLLGEAADGRKALCTFSGEGDPGNRNTVRLCCEAALLLALTPREQLPGGPSRGGLLTPATALGAPYAERLRAAGMTLEVAPHP
jgi:short subunit dehydrogenase-like uncharacterized protein